MCYTIEELYVKEYQCTVYKNIKDIATLHTLQEHGRAIHN